MQHIIKAFEKMRTRKWECIYFAIDVHGTILKSTHDSNATLEYYPGAEEALKYLSTRSDIKLVLYTSSHKACIESLLEDFIQKHIYFDYVNENPEVETDKLSDYSDKFYFDVLIDNKAGFNPDTDWVLLTEVLEQYPHDLWN